jgi:acetyl/propionyl-CoA carboxylase alpha subunit
MNIGGVRTGAPAALAVIEDERFQKGDFDTRFLESVDLAARHGGEDELAAAAAAIFRHHKARQRALSTHTADREGWLARSRRGLASYAQRAAQRESGSERGGA